LDFFSIVKEEASTYGRTEINLIEKPKELSWHLTTPSETWTLKLSQLKAHYVISPDKTMQAGPIPKSWVYEDLIQKLQLSLGPLMIRLFQMVKLLIKKGKEND